MPSTPIRAGCGPPAPRPPAGGLMSTDVMRRLLEVEVVDVVGLEGRQRAEHDLAVGADRVVTETAGLELLTLLAGDPAGRQRGGRLAGEVAHVLGDPELELVDRAVLDDLAHLVREAEAGQL